MKAARLIYDYFNQLDETSKKPYKAFISSNNHFIGFAGLVYHGLYVNHDGVVRVCDYNGIWQNLCDLAEPDSLERIRIYIDQARGLYGEV